MAFRLKSALVTVAQSGEKVPGPAVRTKMVIIHPSEGNGADVYIGGSEVEGGIYVSLLLPPLVIAAPDGGELDLSQFYVDATQSGDSVIFVYLDYVS